MSAADDFLRAFEARMEFYRDLGVYDFYRRDGIPSANVTVEEPETVLERSMSTAVATNTPAASLLVQEAAVEPASQFPILADKSSVLAAIRADIGDCTRCNLSLARNRIVFADGDPNARLMFVGEGPGADEDAQGLPFVGRAGQLLNNMITAMGLRRDQVYIANIVKCRPPSNRVPEPDEAHTCLQFLTRQIDVVRPEVIVALGATAATYLLGMKSALAGLRGRIHQHRGSKLIVTYHPAFLLRDPRQKKEAWKDLQLAMTELGLPQPARAPQA